MHDPRQFLCLPSLRYEGVGATNTHSAFRWPLSVSRGAGVQSGVADPSQLLGYFAHFDHRRFLKWGLGVRRLGKMQTMPATEYMGSTAARKRNEWLGRETLATQGHWFNSIPLHKVPAFLPGSFRAVLHQIFRLGCWECAAPHPPGERGGAPPHQDQGGGWCGSLPATEPATGRRGATTR